MTSLAERLRERIAREGPISFRDFMAAALYDPTEGYYARGAAIGERGDFVTSPSITPAFAATIAMKFSQDAALLPGTVDFVEVGAGGGQFLQDFASAIALQNPDVGGRIRLVAVEKSRTAIAALRQRAILPAPMIYESAEELAPGSVSGWIFSNELYDALPVVRVLCGSEGLEELRVGAGQGGFVWAHAPAPPAFAAHLERFGVTLEPGQVGEISFAAAPLHRRLARALSRGRLVAFDYGHRALTLYHALARRQGTLAVHFAGRRRGDPLARPGEVDLTAHVNWDDLILAGEEEGLETGGVFRQGLFLAEAGLLALTPNDAEKWRAFRLVDPEGMGEELSVLIQSRGMV